MKREMKTKRPLRNEIGPHVGRAKTYGQHNRVTTVYVRITNVRESVWSVGLACVRVDLMQNNTISEATCA